MTDETDDLFTVVLRLLWISGSESDATTGRLLVYRTVAGGRDRPVPEIWLSDVVDELDLLAIRPKSRPSPRVWRRLAVGLRVPGIDEPVPMRPADRDTLAEIVRRLGPSTGHGDDGSRPLLELRTRTRAGDDGPTVESARLACHDTDVLAHPLRSAVEQTVRDLHRSGAAQLRPAMGAADRDTKLRDEVAARIRFEDVRGAQVGDHNVQVNRFIARAERQDVNFDDVLQRDSVVTALERLQRDPDSAGLRQSLVAAMAAEGWWLMARPTRIEAREGSGFAEFLRGLVMFDVRGLQSGDHNRQDNTFVYAISSSPTGFELLRGNTRLARALADHICPASDAEPNVAILHHRLGETMRALPVEWRDGRVHGLQANPPGEAEALRLRRIDGVTIGADNRQLTSEAVDIRVVAISCVAQRRLAAERAEHERQRLAAERVEAQRVKRERADAQRLEREKAEAERAERQRVAAERAEAQRADAQRTASRAMIRMER